MATTRRYCRFSDAPGAGAAGTSPVPKDGLCLCAFVVVASREHPARVLLGKLNPAAAWDHLGALDPGRLTAWGGHWMLPSSHLQHLEAPDDAARRIVDELTGLRPRSLDGPKVTSEVYPPARHPDRREHWDLEFIYRTTASEAELRPHSAWTELRFVDVGTLDPGSIARAQDDILRHAGYSVPTVAPVLR